MASDGSHEWRDEQDLVNYLQGNFINDDGEGLDNEEVLEAVRTEYAEGVIQTGKNVGSYVHFIGDQIAAAEGWVEVDDDEDDEDEDDEDDEDEDEPDDDVDDEDGEQDHAEGLD